VGLLRELRRISSQLATRVMLASFFGVTLGKVVIFVAKIFTFFNHKGGVGKTTLAYNVAWGLSQAGKRVLMIDADAQCNLTEIVVENKYLYDDGQQTLFDEPISPAFFLENNVYEFFSPYIVPLPGQELPAALLFQKKENLKLLTGSIRLAELESNISLSIANVRGLEHIPNSVYVAMQKLSEDVDYVIVDLSPALSATNQLFLMLSDYFIIPVNPSIFSQQALNNLSAIFRRWNRDLSSFEIFSNKKKTLPKMLGIVCQNYRPFARANEVNTTSAERFEKRMSELNDCAIALANDLNGFGMAVTRDEFARIFTSSSPYRIANIPDYNQLAMVSEGEKIPVAGLEKKHLNLYKLPSALNNHYPNKISDFKTECDRIVNGLMALA